jgi:hypothetical protein
VTDREHGTIGTARWHRRSGNLPPCEPCLKAEAEYMAKWRADPENRRRHREVLRAQGKANTKLRQAHPEEHQRYYAEALASIRRPEKETA